LQVVGNTIVEYAVGDLGFFHDFTAVTISSEVAREDETRAPVETGIAFVLNCRVATHTVEFCAAGWSLEC